MDKISQDLARAAAATVPGRAGFDYLIVGAGFAGSVLAERLANVVVAEAARWPADLIVVGTHGRRGLSHVFLGSVAEGIVRSAPVPVLLVRGK